jgi:glycosyltransferase involved in cell wall biosynthesis
MNRYSIILPVYNGGDYFKESVYSILSQTYTAFDLHVLDNHSTDGSSEWIAALKDPRIKMYRSENFLSMEENWKRILTIPKNEMMTIIGHDDLFHADYLSTINDLVEKYPDASLYQSHFRFINANGDFIRPCQRMEEKQSIEEFMISIFTHTIDTMGTGYLMRSSDYHRIGGIHPLPNLLFADHKLWFDLTAISYKATASAECFSYRLHENISKTTNPVKYIRAFYMFMDYLNEFKTTSGEINEVIRKYAPGYISYYCSSLSHRLLKTPVAQREGMTVHEFIEECRKYADKLSPGSNFEPEKQFKIRLARQIDDNSILRNAFLLFKKFYKKPIYS